MSYFHTLATPIDHALRLDALRVLGNAGAPTTEDAALRRRRLFVDALCLKLGGPRRKLSLEGVALAGSAAGVLDLARRWIGPYVAAMGGNVHALPPISLASMALNPNTQAGYFGRLAPVFLNFASADFPGVLRDGLAKAIFQTNVDLPGSCRAWVAERRVDRLVAHSAFATGGTALPVVPEGATYGETMMNEKEEDVALGKRGETITFTREALINDDLGALGDAVARWTGAQGATDDSCVYTTVLAANVTTDDGAALFSTSHSNLTTGALSEASISTARGALAAQVDANGRALRLQARYLIVPPELAETAARVVEPGQANERTRLEVVIAPELSDCSQVEFYVCAHPNRAPAVVLFNLDSEPTPTVEMEEKFSSDGVRFKIRYHVSAAPADWRAIVRSSGS